MSSFAAIHRHRSNSFTEEAEVALANTFDDCLTPISENVGNGAAASNAPYGYSSILNKTKSKSQDSLSLLEPNLSAKYETIRWAYGDLLHRWNLLNERAEVLQYSFILPEKHEGVEYKLTCRSCGSECNSFACYQCKSKAAFCCAICRMQVKGFTSICAICLHGGHTKHMLEWFQDHTKCPTGCGCTCSYA